MHDYRIWVKYLIQIQGHSAIVIELQAATCLFAIFIMIRPR